jgi:predicted nucleic acid-binding protein
VDRVTLDTSVYIGALNSSEFSHRLFEMARTGAIRIDTSEAILDETVRVLREKFDWDGYRLHFARQRLTDLANIVTRSKYWT